MKRIIQNLLLLFLFVSFVNSNAQVPELNAGIAKYEEEKYRESIGYFSKAVENARNLNDYDLSRAYYYRALAWLQLFNEQVTGGKQDDFDTNEQLLLNAYDDLKSTIKLDDEDIAFRAHNQLNDIQYQLTQEGLKWLNHASDLKAGGDPYQKEAGIAVSFLEAAADIAETYLALDLLGQALTLTGKNEEALARFERSEGSYMRQLPEEPDFMMGYVFYRMALIRKEVKNDPYMALKDVERGIKLVDEENQRLGRMSGKMTREEFEELFSQYEQVKSDLNDYRLDIYLESKDLYYEAIKAFEEELAANQDDAELLIGFASLLERSDRDRAIQLYREALQIDPDNAVAAFNIGALYYNKGKDYYDDAQDEPDNDKYSLLFEKALENFELAKPYFEQVLAGDATSLDSIVALKTIAMIFDDQDSYDRYKRMESGFNGGR